MSSGNFEWDCLPNCIIVKVVTWFVYLFMESNVLDKMQDQMNNKFCCLSRKQTSAVYVDYFVLLYLTGSGKIDMEDFIYLMTSLHFQSDHENELKKVFKAFDPNDTGVIK